MSQLDLLAPGAYRDKEFRNGKYFTESRTAQNRTFEQEQMYQFSRRTIKALCDKYEQPLEFQFKITRLTAIRKWTRFPFTCKFLFGYKVVQEFYNYGWRDYANVERYILAYYPRLKEASGFQAVGLVILHEFAHVIQRSQYPTNTANGGVAPHGIEFKKIFRELIRENALLIGISHLTE